MNKGKSKSKVEALTEARDAARNTANDAHEAVENARNASYDAEDRHTRAERIVSDAWLLNKVVRDKERVAEAAFEQAERDLLLAIVAERKLSDD